VYINQVLMRDQPLVLNKFNVLTEMTTLMEHLEKLLLVPPGEDFSFMCDVFVSIMTAIQAMISSCSANQLGLLQGSFFSFVSRVLPLIQYPRHNMNDTLPEDICRLKTAMWELILALVEDTETTVLAREVLSAIGPGRVIDQLRASHEVWRMHAHKMTSLIRPDCWRWWSMEARMGRVIDKILNEAFLAFRLVKYLSFYDNPHWEPATCTQTLKNFSCRKPARLKRMCVLHACENMLGHSVFNFFNKKAQPTH
jgi:hypothetical protein